MRVFVAVSLIACLASCGGGKNPNTGGRPVTGFARTTPGNYVLSVVSGDNQSGPAVLSLRGASVNSSGIVTGAAPSGLLPLPLVVEVRDDQGRLADGVRVLFKGESNANGYLGPLGLGVSVTGWAAGVYAPATPGQAATVAQPYAVGPQHVTVTVDQAGSTANVVTFTVTGF